MSITSDQRAAWEKVLGHLKMHLHEVSYKNWIEPIRLYSVNNQTVTLVCTDIMQPMLKGRYYTDIFNAIQLFFPGNHELKIMLDTEVSSHDPTANATSLNPNYTFDNFVTGPSNSFATAAALAVSEQPGDVYNPLFIYGSVGLGKTHLMNAIGNFILSDDPTKNVVLTTSENFTNEVIQSIVKKDTSGLRAKMRNVDVLMIDDIQFLSKTKATQEEFFHTFNDLYNAKKQIVISSDRPPNEIPTIEDRLRSRFASGLLVDIQRPEYETRIAILRKKATLEKIDITYDVIDYIAQHVDSSIRELEGTLTTLKAQCELMHVPITIEATEEFFIKTKNTRDVRSITPEVIIESVCERYGISHEDMLSPKRSRNISLPRQIAMYLCRKLTDLSTTVVGEAFGGRDHTTVMHAFEKISSDIKKDYSFARQIEELTQAIKNG